MGKWEVGSAEPPDGSPRAKCAAEVLRQEAWEVADEKLEVRSEK